MSDELKEMLSGMEYRIMVRLKGLESKLGMLPSHVDAPQDDSLELESRIEMAKVREVVIKRYPNWYFHVTPLSSGDTLFTLYSCEDGDKIWNGLTADSVWLSAYNSIMSEEGDSDE